MNTTAIPAGELICQLLDAADGIPADVAAAGLIISHGHFLHRDAFRRIISTGTSISTGQPLATIGWDAALRALDAGQMPCASSEQAILRIAASLGGSCWLILDHAARLSSRRARWLVRLRSSGVPVQNASSRRRLRAQAMYTWSRRVLGRPR
jgi:hypothetical protein